MGLLTIGTGLGNARFSNRKSEKGSGKEEKDDSGKKTTKA
jgi:hypothetical protein